MTPPDSGEREVCGHLYEYRVCDENAGHAGRHFHVLVPERDWVLLRSPLAQRILAALDYFAAEGWVAARECASELRAAVERKL